MHTGLYAQRTVLTDFDQGRLSKVLTSCFCIFGSNVRGLGLIHLGIGLDGTVDKEMGAGVMWGCKGGMGNPTYNPAMSHNLLWLSL